jgi:autotransporter adhesin
MNINTRIVLAIALACVVSGRAAASVITIGDGAAAQYDCDIAIGDDASAAGGHGAGPPVPYYCAVAVGQGAQATGTDTTAIGNQSLANSPGGTAIGATSQAIDWFTTAIGSGSQATMMSASAFGSGAVAGHYNSVALGASTQTTRDNEVAVGNRQIGQVADGTAQDDAVNLRQLEAAIDNVGGSETHYFKAYGPSDGSDDAFATGEYSVGIGSNANAQNRLDIAIGARATANSGVSDPSCINAIAVGADTTAQGCGAIAQGSGATANGSATVALGQSANAAGNFAVAVGQGANAAGDVALAIGSQSTAAQISVAIGAHSLSAVGAVAIGTLAEASGVGSVAVGGGSKAPNENSVALGQGTQTTRDNEVAVGNRQIGQVADGVDAQDAVNVRQLTPMADALGGGASFFGGVFTPPSYQFLSGAVYTDVGSALADLDARVWSLEQNPGGGGTPGPVGPIGPQGNDGRSAYEVAIANGFEGTEQEWLESLEGADGRDGRDGVGGSKLKGGSNIVVSDNADGTQTASLKDNIELSDEGSLKVGKTTVNGDGVSIEGGPSMTTKGIDAGDQKITSVAPGRIERGSTDAVNGGQIYDLQSEWDDRWTEINNRYDQTNKRIDGLGAQMGAMTMMAATPGEGGMTVGVGASGSQAALAVGWSRRINKRVSVSAGAAFGGGNKPVVGVGVRIGGR